MHISHGIVSVTVFCINLANIWLIYVVKKRWTTLIIMLAKLYLFILEKKNLIYHKLLLCFGTYDDALFLNLITRKIDIIDKSMLEMLLN